MNRNAGMIGLSKSDFRSSASGLLIIYIISMSAPNFRASNFSDSPAFHTLNPHSTFPSHLHNFQTFTPLIKMSFTHDHDDFEALESFEPSRIDDHDEFEANQPLETPIPNADVPTIILGAGLGGPLGHMPVSITCLPVISSG